MTLIEKKILNLKKLLLYHNYLYYSLDSPIITDHEYDFLYKKFKILKKKYYYLDIFKNMDNIKKFISFNTFKLNNHFLPMLSLHHTFDLNGCIQFYKNIKKYFSNHIKVHFFCEVKFDGLALSLLYQKGKLIRALTRGDGIRGENVTKNTYMIKNIPKYLYDSNVPELFEVRGEVCMLKKDLDMLNIESINNNKKIFSNTRNAAAGTLRQNDPNIVKKRNLFFYAYALNIFKEKFFLKKHSEQLYFLHYLGFAISPYIVLSSKLQRIFNFYALMSNIRNFLSFNIDGIVIKIDDIKYQKKIGNTNKYPRWAIALKFFSQSSKTILLHVSYQVGRTGIITPIAHLKPILLSGVIIKKASLHNSNFIKILGLYIGDSVIICRSGDVIPKVESVVLEDRKDNFKKIIFPQYCPSCNSLLCINDNESIIKCLAGWNCIEQKKKMIEHFFSKHALYAKGFGVAIIEKLVLYGYVRSPIDCFKLNMIVLSKLKSFGKISAYNIIYAINQCKCTSLHKFIYALGIPNIGIEHSKLLESNFKTLEKIMSCTKNELLKIKNFGKKKANIFFHFITNGQNIKYIMKLIQVSELQFMNNRHIFTLNKVTIFMKKNIVLSGKFKKYSRIELINKISSLGGHVLNIISKKIDFLIVGKNPGNKVLKASNLNIKILQEYEMEKYFKYDL